MPLELLQHTEPYCFFGYSYKVHSYSFTVDYLLIIPNLFKTIH